MGFHSFLFSKWSMMEVSWMAFLSVVLLSAPVLAADDDYLKSLEAESEKVDPGASTIQTESNTVPSSSRRITDEKRAEFELYLQENQKGTHAFYSSLSPQAREEILKAYADGATDEDIRVMVINRKLNR